MHERKINNAFETRREEGIPSASFSYDGYKIADLAVRSLICEVDTTPKPGLVDRENNGAHTDMDHFMFLRSALALRPCFVQCAELGLSFDPAATADRGFSAEDAETLRQIGLAGERAMFEATGGVNTHKGLVFSLGILCAACGLLFSVREEDSDGAMKFDGEELRGMCAEIAALLLKDDAGKDTHGEEVRRTTGISGVKGEALSGFRTAFEEGLPVLRETLEWTDSMNVACVRTLIHLLAKTDDSNLVYRGGLSGLEFVRRRAKELVEQFGRDLNSDEGSEEIRRFDSECIQRNLSPGGCADLLAITIMLHFVVK